jgi:prepilin-type N-terminal cleavage/methylation domain-containing protein
MLLNSASNGPSASRQGGFTIFELLIASFILAVMLGLALPKLSEAVAAHRILSSTRATVSYVRLVRSTAVARNAPARLVVNESGKRLSMQVQKGGVWTAAGSDQPMEEGVVVAAVEPAALVFHPQGTASATTITLTGERGSTREVVVSILGSLEVR